MNRDADNEMEMIRQLEDEPVPPGLRERLLADASVAAGARARNSSAIWDVRSHIGLKLKRLTLATGFSIALLMLSINSLGYAFAGAL